MAAVRNLVVIASAEPATTDALADLLREACAVRTAYDTADVLDRLDEDVDVVLVDPDLGADAVGTVRDAVAERGLPCQFGLLAAVEDGERDPPEGVDAAVPPSTDDESVRETVEWLATRATYRRTLDEYYDLAFAVADLRGDDGEVTDDLESLADRLDRLRERLDETASDLDSVSLFEAALDPE